jgi:hypothetical protein
MWAHYADDHQGCVIEFKFEETEGFIEEFINLKPEEDTTTLIPLDEFIQTIDHLFDNDGLTNSDTTGTNACLVKAKVWEYE